MNFQETLKKLRTRACKSRYRLAQHSGVNQAYILRLEGGERGNPSRDVVLMLGFARVEASDSVAIWDIDELLMSAEYAPLRKRGLRPPHLANHLPIVDTPIEIPRRAFSACVLSRRSGRCARLWFRG